MTTRETISAWYDQAIDLDATHLIVVVDEFDMEDYPVYVRVEPNKKGQRDGRVIVTDDLRALIKARFDQVNMQRVMECYDLSLSKAVQMAEPRAMHL